MSFAKELPMNISNSSLNFPVLAGYRKLLVRQIFEVAEFFGFETRNKYEILDETGSLVAYAAEQQKGIFGFLLRQYLGHWRVYDVQFFTRTREPFFRAHHPFRFLFHRFEIYDTNGAFIGALQQRFAILSKKFEVETMSGQAVMEMTSPIWRVWTFPFTSHGRTRAQVSKKWGGVLTEVFTDRDTFLVEYGDETLSESERKLVLAASVFIDMRYFETKASDKYQ
jgi:uncharacterized protein YxjI